MNITNDYSMMHVAHKMRVEVVHVSASLTASVAFPWVGIAVESSVQKVQGLVWEDNIAVLALPLTGVTRGHDKTSVTRFVGRVTSSNRGWHDYSLLLWPRLLG